MFTGMVSIIIPAYNVKNFIGPCIESALSQTYKDLQIIVVNDGSTDGTDKVLGEHSAKWPQINVYSQSNKGLSEARNTGLDHADGEWVVFLDGDDCLLPNAVDTLLTTANRYDASIACGAFVTDFHYKLKKSYPTRALDAETAIVNTLYQKRGFFNSAWAKIYRRSLFENIRFRPGINYEDMDVFYLLYKKAGRIAYTDCPVLYYRTNPSSILHSFTSRRLDVLDVTRRIEEWASTRSRLLQRAAAERRRSAAFNILGLILANDCRESYADSIEKCRNIIRQKRFASLADPRVRLKNKAGILASFLGDSILDKLLLRHYKANSRSAD